MQSGFDPKLCFGDALMSFAWSGSAAGSAPTPLSETPKKTKSAKYAQHEIEEKYTFLQFFYRIIPYQTLGQHGKTEWRYNHGQQLEATRLCQHAFPAGDPMWFLSTQNLAKRCGPMQRLRHVLSQEMHNQMSKFHDMRPSGCGGRFSSHSSIRRIQIDRSRRHRGWGGRFWGERRGTWAHTQCHGIEDLIIYLFIYS